MGKITDKKYLAFMANVNEGTSEAALVEVCNGTDEEEVIDPRYVGLEEVYHQDTQGKLNFIPQARQVRTIEDFDPISVKFRKGKNSELSEHNRSVVACPFYKLGGVYGSLVANFLDGRYRDNPHRSVSHPSHSI